MTETLFFFNIYVLVVPPSFPLFPLSSTSCTSSLISAIDLIDFGLSTSFPLSFSALSSSYNYRLYFAAAYPLCSLFSSHHYLSLNHALCYSLSPPSRCLVQYCEFSYPFLALCIFFFSLSPSLHPSPSNSSWPCSDPVLHTRLPHRNVLFVHKHDKRIDKNVSAQRQVSDQKHNTIRGIVKEGRWDLSSDSSFEFSDCQWCTHCAGPTQKFKTIIM